MHTLDQAIHDALARARALGRWDGAALARDMDTVRKEIIAHTDPGLDQRVMIMLCDSTHEAAIDHYTRARGTSVPRRTVIIKGIETLARRWDRVKLGNTPVA